jgi:ABC-type uncharacterized transport system auxiliary subunit
MKRLFSICALIMTGCVNVLPNPSTPPTVLSLEGSSPPPLTSHPRPFVVMIERPSSSQWLDSKRLSIHYMKNQLPVQDYIAAYEWPQRLPDVLHGLVADDLRHHQLFKGVVLPNDIMPHDQVLLMTIHAWDIMKGDDRPFLKASLTLTLSASPSRSLIKQQVITHTIPLQDLTPAYLGKAYQKMALWMLEKVKEFLKKEEGS